MPIEIIEFRCNTCYSRHIYYQAEDNGVADGFMMCYLCGCLMETLDENSRVKELMENFDGQT